MQVLKSIGGFEVWGNVKLAGGAEVGALVDSEVQELHGLIRDGMSEADGGVVVIEGYEEVLEILSGVLPDAEYVIYVAKPYRWFVGSRGNECFFKVGHEQTGEGGSHPGAHCCASNLLECGSIEFKEVFFQDGGEEYRGELTGKRRRWMGISVVKVG